ncbi:UvrD-helicase domain-containing protein [Tunturiibacter psychrotolerans]|uniref:UvrD-helicase domain-containing protein n=1 Tax=Tunturiibacter psychrotolerans TaxID=3069686 RepID=UPI003D21E99D
MIPLNDEQRLAVDTPGNVVVTACPGSGKTRVLAARVVRGLTELKTRRERVIALTYTNRAADEIQSRLDEADVAAECLWAGTIHSFALEWILRPYAPYCTELQYGFSVVNEYFAEQLLSRLKAEAGLAFFDDVHTGFGRDGADQNTGHAAQAVFESYKAELRRLRAIDFDDVLYLAYRLLHDRPEIAETLGAIVRVICVDEAQDIQDLQYGILKFIHRAARDKPSLFFVGDENQSIYESLGAMTKSPSEIATEFELTTINHLELHGNYRSTQRIIDFYRLFRANVPRIDGRSKWAGEDGLITFENQTVALEGLAAAIASRITAALSEGVATNDICVIAPRWMHIKPLARLLVNHLPEVDFDAPGLSPLHSSYENFWFKVGRLMLTRPSPRRTRTRMRWAREAITDLRTIAAIEAPSAIDSPRRLLRLLNGLSSNQSDGIAYLRDVFAQFLKLIDFDMETCLALKESYLGFFEKAESHLSNAEDLLPRDIESFRRLFSHPSGVVVNTCHGVKGEEYDTVIAFGLLRGFVPHWDVIINHSVEAATDQESKLLYVICSRAKRKLHLIAETGRHTKSKRAYQTSELLAAVRFELD